MRGSRTKQKRQRRWAICREARERRSAARRAYINDLVWVALILFPLGLIGVFLFWHLSISQNHSSETPEPADTLVVAIDR